MTRRWVARKRRTYANTDGSRQGDKEEKGHQARRVDACIITEEGIPKFDDIGPFKCEFISNRGTKVWPGFVSSDLLMVNWYRCRFMATRDITDADVNAFMAELTTKGW